MLQLRMSFTSENKASPERPTDNEVMQASQLQDDRSSESLLRLKVRPEVAQKQRQERDSAASIDSDFQSRPESLVSRNSQRLSRSDSLQRRSDLCGAETTNRGDRESGIHSQIIEEETHGETDNCDEPSETEVPNQTDGEEIRAEQQSTEFESFESEVPNQTDGEETRAEQTPANEFPETEVPHQTDGEETRSEQTPADESPGTEVPNQTDGEGTRAEQTPADESPKTDVPAVREGTRVEQESTEFQSPEAEVPNQTGEEEACIENESQDGDVAEAANFDSRSSYLSSRAPPSHASTDSSGANADIESLSVSENPCQHQAFSATGKGTSQREQQHPQEALSNDASLSRRGDNISVRGSGLVPSQVAYLGQPTAAGRSTSPADSVSARDPVSRSAVRSRVRRRQQKQRREAETARTTTTSLAEPVGNSIANNTQTASAAESHRGPRLFNCAEILPYELNSPQFSGNDALPPSSE